MTVEALANLESQNLQGLHRCGGSGTVRADDENGCASFRFHSVARSAGVAEARIEVLKSVCCEQLVLG